MKIIPQNNLTVITFYGSFEEIISATGSIIELYGDSSIKQGTVLQSEYSTIKIGKISKLPGRNGIIYKTEHTLKNSSYYVLLPMLINSASDRFNLGVDEIIANCFCYHESNFANNVGYLLVRNVQIPRYITKYNNLISLPNLVGLESADKFYDLIAFTIPEQWLKDYELFKEGKYSKLSDDAKKNTLNFIGNNLVLKNLMVQRFNKDENLRIELEKTLRTTIPKNSELLSPPYQLDTFIVDRDTIMDTIRPKNPSEAF